MISIGNSADTLHTETVRGGLFFGCQPFMPEILRRSVHTWIFHGNQNAVQGRKKLHMERNPSGWNLIGSRYRVIKQIAEKCSQVSIWKKINGVIFNRNFKSYIFCVAEGLITKQCCVKQGIITDANGGFQLFGVYECLDILVKFGVLVLEYK